MLIELINRVRRNHALEHAAIHVLSEKFRFSAQGNSDHRGFRLNIFGDVSEEDVFNGVEEAFQRLKAGEHQLAIQPNCGTVLLTTATLTTLAAQATFSLERKRQNQNAMTGSVFFNALPSAILAVVFVLIASRPLGIHLQAKYTVDSDLGDMQISRIRRVSPTLITRLFQLLLTPGQQSTATSYKIETIR